MDPELKPVRISIGIHAAVAILMGRAAVQVSPLLAAALAIVALVITGFAVERIVRKKGIGWWAGNGMAIYLLVWLVSWIFFFNVS